MKRLLIALRTSEKTLVDKNNGNTPLDLNANITKNIEIVISE